MSNILDAIESARPSIPTEPVPDYSGPPFSLIVPTQPEKMAQAQQVGNHWATAMSDLAQPNLPFMPVAGARSYAEAFNAIVGQVQTPYIIFAHNDAYPPAVPSYRMGQRLLERMKTLDLAAFCGSSKFAGPRWQDSNVALFGSVLNIPNVPPGTAVQPTAQLWQKPARIVRGIRTMDGYAFVIRTEVARKLGMATDLPAWHFYDLDLCLRAHEAGFRTGVITDIYILHQSSVGYADPNWEAGVEGFLNKWKGKADPQPVGIGVTPGSLTGIDARMILSYMRSQERFMADEVTA